MMTRERRTFAFVLLIFSLYLLVRVICGA